MKIFVYTAIYASKTTTFITNEVAKVSASHDLLLAYSTRQNPELYNVAKMIEIPYAFNRFSNKIRWWLEQFQITYLLKNSFFKRKVNETINEFKPDVIHCHFGTDFLKLAANLNDKNKKIPCLISFYGFDVTEKIKNKAILKKYRHYLSLPNVHAIAVAETLVKNINEVIKPFNKAKVLHSGTDTDFFIRKNYTREEGTFTFIQVSSFLQKKGHKYTLQAFRKFIDQNKKYKYKFIIAGLGPLEEEVLAQIKELNFGDAVSFIGTVTPAEMVELGSRADCFVQMSITADNGDQEGLPNILLEAMSLELPIVSTRHAGIPEIVVDGENGILCDEKNIGQYVEAFTKITEWKKCPQNRERIVKHFSIKSHMAELDNLYKQISAK